MRRGPLWVGWLLASTLLAASSASAAWTDARPAGLVTELTVDRDGGATVTLRVRWRVLAGRFHTFELAEMPNDLTLLEATASDATGNAVPVTTRIPAAGRLELTLGEDGGVRRGAIDVIVRYVTSLRAQGLIQRRGDDAVLEVSTVPWERGLEAAEIRVALPSSVRRAAWIADDTPGVEATVASEPGRDVIHALRRHLPASTRWTGRIACDPSLFVWLDRPQTTVVATRHERHRETLPTMALAAALMASLGAATAWLRRGGGPPMVRLPTRFGLAPIGMAILGGGVQALVRLDVPGMVCLGSVLIAGAWLLSLPRTAPVGTARVASARLWPDARMAEHLRQAHPSRSASIVASLALATAIAVGLAAFLHRNASIAVVAMDLAGLGLAILAVRRVRAPGGDATLLARVTGTIAKRVTARGTARLAWRVRGDGSQPGDVSRRLLPRPGHRFVRGVHAIEWSLHWQRGTLRWRACVQFAVRIDRGTILERSLRRLATNLGTLSAGRTDDELCFTCDLVGPDVAAARRACLDLLEVALVANASSSGRDTALPASGQASAPQGLPLQ